MIQSMISSRSVADYPLWDKMLEKRSILQFRIELTARCNNDCRHCYICLPSFDRAAKEKELPLEDIINIADQTVEMGALWCTITGGEPLLREDFPSIYIGLKRKGLLVSVYTNACLVNEEHIDLFKRYPPKDIEVTVYGISKETYESVTRRPGSFDAFMRGLGLLLDNGLKVRLKAMAMRSNVHEIPAIADFCRQRTCDYFRFDPFLTMRLDRDQARNREIKAERLTPKEIVALEKSDSERFHALEWCCNKLINSELCRTKCDHLFHCGAGVGSFVLTYDGHLRLCLSLQNPDCIYNLRKGSLADAWKNFVSKVRSIRSSKKEYLEACRVCPIINLCFSCPAHAYLEEGSMDAQVPYFCQVAHTRAEALGYGQKV